MSNNAKHSSVSVEHYTPSEIVEAARMTMGDIDLDPASCDVANTIVQAARFFTKEDNGLLQTWSGKVFLNPPGGKIDGKSSSTVWWKKLLESPIEEAIFVGFSLEFLQTAQMISARSPIDFPFCVPDHRLKFLDENLHPQTSPTHANVIIYVPPVNDLVRLERIARFQSAFFPYGDVCIPYHA